MVTVTTFVIAVLSLGACEANKRILLEDNYYAIVQRLEALETKAQVQDSKAQAMEMEIADLKRENGKLIVRRFSTFNCCLTTFRKVAWYLKQIHQWVKDLFSMIDIVL